MSGRSVLNCLFDASIQPYCNGQVEGYNPQSSLIKTDQFIDHLKLLGLLEELQQMMTNSKTSNHWVT
jgi:hypothetical protein